MNKFVSWFGVNKSKIYKIIIISALCFMGLFMVFVVKQSFWFDELDWTMAFIDGQSLSDIFKSLAMGFYNMPVYYLIICPWFSIWPTNILWLLIPNITAVIVGIVFVGKIGKLLGGEDIQFWAIILCVLSSVLVQNGAWQFRPYAFVFLFSAITLFFFIKKIKKQSLKNNILFGLFITLTIFTHWFGALLAFFYGATELLFWITKKTNFKPLFTYIIPALLLALWFLIVCLNKVTNITEYWVSAPKLHSFFKPIVYALSYNPFLVLIFFVGLILIASKFYKRIKNKETAEMDSWFIIICCIFFVIGSVFIYSIINTKASLFLNRYFFVLIPHIILVCALGFQKTFSLIYNKNEKNNLQTIPTKSKRNFFAMLIVSIICLLFVSGGINYGDNIAYSAKSEDNYAPAVDYLLENYDDLNDEKTLVLCVRSMYSINYYFYMVHKQVPKNMALVRAPSLIGLKTTFYDIPFSQENNLYSISQKNNGKFTFNELETIELLKYDRIYVYGHTKATYWNDVKTYLNENFTIEKTPQSSYLIVYNKN